MRDTVEESIYKLNRSRAVNLIISGNTKNQDQLALTLKDVESLFSLMVSAGPPENADEKMGSLRHLPPSVAAALAAEKRLQNHSSHEAEVTTDIHGNRLVMSVFYIDISA